MIGRCYYCYICGQDVSNANDGAYEYLNRIDFTRFVEYRKTAFGEREEAEDTSKTSFYICEECLDSIRNLVSSIRKGEAE